MKVVLPEPDGPTRKTNSPLSISTVQSFRATVDPLYVLVTFWNLIMGKRTCGEDVGRRVRDVRRRTCVPGGARRSGSAPLTSDNTGGRGADGAPRRRACRGATMVRRDQPVARRRSAPRRSSASISMSRSPSRTASTLPVSALVRRSLTSWYGAIT